MTVARAVSRDSARARSSRARPAASRSIARFARSPSPPACSCSRSSRSSRTPRRARRGPRSRTRGSASSRARNWDPNSRPVRRARLHLRHGPDRGRSRSCIAVPVSLGIALFTTELAPAAARTAVTYVVDLLAAIPSVVYGFWALAVLDAARQTTSTRTSPTRSARSRCSAASSAAPRAARAS